EPGCIPDVVDDANFPRAPLAREVGLHGAFGFPIRLGADVLGVIEFFSHKIREPDAELLEMFSAIGSQLGQFIERRRAEAALRASEQRWRTLFEQCPLSVQILAPDGRTRQVNSAWEKLWGASPDAVRGWNLLEDEQLRKSRTLSRVRRAFAGEV